MRHITPRELMEVEHEIKTGLIYGLIREYFASKLVETRNEARVLSSNLTSLLEREQKLGQINLLETFHDDFHNHVVHVVTKQPTETKDTEHES